MKTILRSLAASILALLARAIVKKYHPTIVMVTGSVGKTSTKDALAAALGEKTYLRASEKSYNSEFGVPLTIIGVKNAWSSLFGWIRIMGEACALILLPNHYPKLLVLEVGADRPGDLEKILRIATPDAVVVTRLPDVPVHVEAYATPQAVREEEFAPAYALAPGAPLVVSADDEYAMMLAKRTEARITSFGYAKHADVRIEHPTLIEKDGYPVGMQSGASICAEEGTITVQGALGRTQLLAPAAALAAAIALGHARTEAEKGLSHYLPPPGRSRILKGKKGSVLIDDSYNASPAAVEEALGALALLKTAKRRIAVLGDMLELGRYSVGEHERIGALAATVADIVVAVGHRAIAVGEAAQAHGLPESDVHAYPTAIEAARALEEEVQEGDVILIKGSQSIRMERIVEQLLADPADMKYLVRQEKEWKKR